MGLVTDGFPDSKCNSIAPVTLTLPQDKVGKTLAKAQGSYFFNCPHSEGRCQSFNSWVFTGPFRVFCYVEVADCSAITTSLSPKGWGLYQGSENWKVSSPTNPPMGWDRVMNDRRCLMGKLPLHAHSLPSSVFLSKAVKFSVCIHWLKKV